MSLCTRCLRRCTCRDDAVAAERAAIVRWLREVLVGGEHIVPIAECIERGEHLE